MPQPQSISAWQPPSLVANSVNGGPTVATTRLIERTVPVAAPGGNVAPASAPIVPNAAGPAPSALSVAALPTAAGCCAAAASSTGCCCWLAAEDSAGVCAGAGDGGCALQVTLALSLQRARYTVPPTRSPRACDSTSGETVTSTSTLFAIICGATTSLMSCRMPRSRPLTHHGDHSRVTAGKNPTVGYAIAAMVLQRAHGKAKLIAARSFAICACAASKGWPWICTGEMRKMLIMAQYLYGNGRSHTSAVAARNLVHFAQLAHKRGVPLGRPGLVGVAQWASGVPPKVVIMKLWSPSNIKYAALMSDAPHVPPNFTAQLANRGAEA